MSFPRFMLTSLSSQATIFTKRSKVYHSFLLLFPSRHEHKYTISLSTFAMTQPGEESSNIIVIDEDGDTILILENPIESLREWPGSIDSSSDDGSESSSDSETEEDAEDTVGQADTASASARDIEKTKVKLHYQVSSVLLRNASQYFRNMFSGSFSESMVNSEDGKYHIGAQGFNPKAMEHVMNVLHLRTRNIPRKVDLELLAHIAVLVDYYDLKETVSFHAEIWVKAAARKKFPDNYDCTLVLRTFVARIFEDKKNFKRGAEIIAMNSSGPIPDLGIPLFGLDGRFTQLYRLR